MQRNVGSLTFENPLVFGGGTCKTFDDVVKALNTNVAGVEIGSISPDGGAGNEGDNFYAHYQNGVLIFTLNSLGLPNPGKDAWTFQAHEAIRRAHGAGKKIGMNVMAKTPELIVQMVLWALDLNFDWVTINAGCPNKFDETGKPMAILSFTRDDMEHLLDLLSTRVGATGREIWLKGSVFSDRLGAMRKYSSLIAMSETITGQINNNTFGQCFAYKNATQAIEFGNGLAGMGGPATKPIAMGDLRMMDSLLPARFHKIASGGATYGQDIIDFIRAGAHLVQCTSVVWANNLDYSQADRMLTELIDHPDYTSVFTT